MSDQKNIQEKLVRYQVLEGRINALIKRRDLLIAKMLEIETTLSSIGEIEKNKEGEIFLPLGSSVHIPGTLKKTKKMIVELGMGIVVERNVEETKDILEKRRSILNSGLQAIEKEMVNLSNELLNLEPEINALLEKAKTPSSGRRAS